MVRQCAWCLRLINSAGERLSPSPLPKLYEASHGICGICGMQWMEQVIEADQVQPAMQSPEIDTEKNNDEKAQKSTEVEQHDKPGQRESIMQLVFQMQRSSHTVASTKSPAKRLARTKLRLL